MGKVYCDKENAHAASAQRAKERILSSSDVEQMCQIFHILSDASRLKIVLALINGDMCVYHLTEVCDSSVSAVSHQLRVLRDNNIVRSKRMGKNVEYSIADNHVREIVEMAVAHLACVEEK